MSRMVLYGLGESLVYVRALLEGVWAASDHSLTSLEGSWRTVCLVLGVCGLHPGCLGPWFGAFLVGVLGLPWC